MKKSPFTFLLLFVFFVSSLQAQTEKGNILLGGTATFGGQFSDFNDILGISLNPNLGLFVADQIAIGSSLDFAFSKIDEATGTSFGLTPFARYYFGAGVGPVFFVQAKAGFNIIRVDTGFDAATRSNGIFGAGPGLAYFLNERIAIEGILELVRFTGDVPFTDLGLRIGVQAYLGRGE